MTKVNTSICLMYNFVKYDKLVSLIDKEYKNTNTSTFNIYIDLNSLFRSLYSPNVIIDDKLDISSTILNLIGHYRHFFKTRYGVWTNIYLVYSNNMPVNNILLYPEYNAATVKNITNNTKIANNINDNLDIIEILVKYIQDVYFVQDIYETAVIIKYLCNNVGIEAPNLVLSRDIYNFQLVDDNTKILVPNKYNNTDSSYIVNTSNAIEHYCKKEFKSDYGFGLDGGLLSLLMSLSKCSKRNIRSLFKVSDAIKIIQSSIDSNRILNGYNTDGILKVSLPRHIDDGYLMTRFRICDIASQYISYINSPNIHITPNNFVNLDNPNELKNIVNKWFIKNPIILENL